jgi:hypothetical protein
MADTLELLVKIQELVIKCRRVAAETPDSNLALWLYHYADGHDVRPGTGGLFPSAAASFVFAVACLDAARSPYQGYHLSP